MKKTFLSLILVLSALTAKAGDFFEMKLQDLKTPVRVVYDLDGKSDVDGLKLQVKYTEKRNGYTSYSKKTINAVSDNTLLVGPSFFKKNLTLTYSLMHIYRTNAAGTILYYQNGNLIGQQRVFNDSRELKRLLGNKGPKMTSRGKYSDVTVKLKFTQN